MNDRLDEELRALGVGEPTPPGYHGVETRVLQAIVARARAGATVLVVGHREPVLAIGEKVLYMGSMVDA